MDINLDANIESCCKPESNIVLIHIMLNIQLKKEISFSNEFPHSATYQMCDLHKLTKMLFVLV